MYIQNHGILTKTLNYNVLFYNQENSKKPEDKRTIINVIEDLYSYVKTDEKENFVKITICDKDKCIFNSILKKLKNIKETNILDVAHMSRKIIQIGTKEVGIEYFYTEISSKNVHKWNAILYLINLLGIKQEEVMAIGDNANDRTMIENAGKGVAMGNSVPYIKLLADEVVENNNANGVAEAIEKFAF